MTLNVLHTRALTVKYKNGLSLIIGRNPVDLDNGPVHMLFIKAVALQGLIGWK